MLPRLVSSLLHFRSFRHYCISSTGQVRNYLSNRSSTSELPAFVFDIDGVLVRGKQVLEPARRAMQLLFQGDQDFTYPVAFLTNGGGVSEACKAQQLSQWLGVPVHERQVVLSHTPFKSLVPLYATSPVLVLGRGQAHQVAQQYGFTQVVSTEQLFLSAPSAAPFAVYTGDHTSGGEQCPVRERGVGSEANPIRAVLVFNDPSDWYKDLQLTMDVLLAGGVLGRRSAPAGHPPVPIYFSTPDLLWANDFPVPRFGQGAFAAALDALHRQVTGSPIPNKRFYGKPNAEPYRLVESLLRHEAGRLGLGTSRGSVEGPGGGGALQFDAIYAVGDNPAADVRGANAAGHPWVSVLVRTGVFEGGENCSVDPASLVVDTVEHAVRHALSQHA